MTQGDLGLGTVQALDGELVVLDGECFQVTADGSVLRPASFCGDVGYKPTYNLICRGGIKFAAESRDTIGLLMRADGKDITTPTYADAEPSFDRLQRAVSDGEIAGFNGNEYVNDLATGNLAAAIAWSGDVASTPPARGARGSEGTRPCRASS